MPNQGNNSKATPGVIALPPLISLAGLAPGIALEFVYPLPLFGSPLSHVIGWPLLAIALASAIWGAVIGGGIVVGLGYSLGAIRTYMQPPEELSDER